LHFLLVLLAVFDDYIAIKDFDVGGPVEFVLLVALGFPEHPGVAADHVAVILLEGWDVSAAVVYQGIGELDALREILDLLFARLYIIQVLGAFGWFGLLTGFEGRMLPSLFADADAALLGGLAGFLGFIVLLHVPCYVFYVLVTFSVDILLIVYFFGFFLFI